MNKPTFKPVSATVNFIKRNERKILVTTTVVSTTAAVAMGVSVAQHNEFLKQNGLFEQFYNIADQDI